MATNIELGKGGPCSGRSATFTSKEEIARALGTAKRYEPQLDEDEAERLVREWRRAVKNARE